MAIIKVYSYDRKQSVEVEIDNISSPEYESIRKKLTQLLEEEQAYKAIAKSFIYAVQICPLANPSDIWQHIIYRIYLDCGRNEQSWKRASGQAFEEAFIALYNPHFIEYGVRLVVLTKLSASNALFQMGLQGKIAPSKMDIAIEGDCGTGNKNWKILGVIHAKTSIAERIKDDAPASKIIMNKGFLSTCITLDSKSFPPPHGDAINYGELGGRVPDKLNISVQPKRDYFEVDGDFTNCYSYNLRTPPSPEITRSGFRINTLSFSEDQPDKFVRDTLSFWNVKKHELCV
ncbi:MAG: restriction endonuclease [Cytophagales bacterium]|nr:restriction endonuclease [Cytophagales bacterium]